MDHQEGFPQKKKHLLPWMTCRCKVQCKLLQDHFRLTVCEELLGMIVTVINTESHTLLKG